MHLPRQARAKLASDRDFDRLDTEEERREVFDQTMERIREKKKDRKERKKSKGRDRSRSRSRKRSRSSDSEDHRDSKKKSKDRASPEEGEAHL